MRLKLLWSGFSLYAAVLALLLYVAGWAALNDCEGMGCLALKLMWIYWWIANAVVAPFALALVLLSRGELLLGRLSRCSGAVQLILAIAAAVFLVVIFPEPWNL
jgi:hypothetical protein